jgi:hypothetical protein
MSLRTQVLNVVWDLPKILKGIQNMASASNHSARTYGRIGFFEAVLRALLVRSLVEIIIYLYTHIPMMW